jgi:hypothetical protein
VNIQQADLAQQTGYQANPTKANDDLDLRGASLPKQPQRVGLPAVSLPRRSSKSSTVMALPFEILEGIS